MLARAIDYPSKRLKCGLSVRVPQLFFRATCSKCCDQDEVLLLKRPDNFQIAGWSFLTTENATALFAWNKVKSPVLSFSQNLVYSSRYFPTSRPSVPFGRSQNFVALVVPSGALERFSNWSHWSSLELESQTGQ